MDDNQIIALFFSRDEEAIRQTDIVYGKRLLNLSENIAKNEQDAQECVNDTYLKAWNSMPNHRPSHLAPYLAKLTRWLSLNRLRGDNSLKRGGGEFPMVLDELAETLDSGMEISSPDTAWRLRSPSSFTPMSTKTGSRPFQTVSSGS